MTALAMTLPPHLVLWRGLVDALRRPLASATREADGDTATLPVVSDVSEVPPAESGGHQGRHRPTGDPAQWHPDPDRAVWRPAHRRRGRWSR